MKTTKSKQDNKRRAILRSAVDLITEQGYDKTTMKQIARAADVGDATIYKYFPTKEKLLIGYYEEAIADVLKDTAAIPEVDQYTLHERLHLLIDGVLESLLADREFVAITKSLVGRAPLVMRDGLPGRTALKQEVAALLDQAEQRGEIVPCDFKAMLAGFFPDYLMSVVMYWLDDESEEFANTTQLVELTLGLLVLVLKSGLVDKVSDLVGFLVRSQMSRLMQHGSGLLGMLEVARRRMGH